MAKWEFEAQCKSPAPGEYLLANRSAIITFIKRLYYNEGLDEAPCSQCANWDWN